MAKEIAATMSNRSKEPPGHRFVQLGRARVVKIGETCAQLTNGKLTAELSVLSEDLFRLRVAPDKELTQAHSWSVAPKAWEPPRPRVIRNQAALALETTRGRFEINLTTGKWLLRDSLGLTVFEVESNSTGFVGSSPRLSLCLQEDEAIFGLGESTGTFNKRGLIREFWNIDVGGHARTVHANLRNLYISIPFALSLRHGRVAGVFWDNPGRQTWDIGQTKFSSLQLSAATGEIDLYFFLGPTCAEVLTRYTELTGRMPLPPQWALGYQQCRYSYETRRRVEEIAGAFRSKRIPCDVLYLDIHYMDGYRVFTFGKAFPNQTDLVRRLARQGFKVVTIVDPGVKDDPEFPVLKRGLAEGAFVKDAGGKDDYHGQVWPGEVRFPDFLNPRTRRWWGHEQVRFQNLGIAGFWNDMNEPADFSAPNKDFPAACLHETEWGPVRHGDVHNVYGSQMARASYEGALAGRPNQRPFIVSRAGYAGLQKYAAVWTGDNDSSWEHLADSVQMLLNLSISGIAFCGADVGGFHYNTTGELLARWTQLAAFTPFFRNHSNIGTIDQEPWAFGPQIEAICRRYIELRYQLLPYFYGLFVQAHRNGAPPMRPMFWHYPNDPIAVAAGDQFLLGSELLIAPILRQGATSRSVYLPMGVWFNFWTGEELRGGQHVLANAPLDLLPLFVKAAAVIPIIPVQQYVAQKKIELVNLHIWPGDGSELQWYEDDGISLQNEHGAFHERTISLQRRKNTHSLRFAESQGTFPTEIKKWRVVLRNVPRPVRAKSGKRSLPVGYNPELGVCAFEKANETGRFEVEWR